MGAPKTGTMVFVCLDLGPRISGNYVVHVEFYDLDYSGVGGGGLRQKIFTQGCMLGRNWIEMHFLRSGGLGGHAKQET